MVKTKYNFIQLILVLYLFFLIIISPKIDGSLFNNFINPVILLFIFIISYKYTENNHGRFENLKENKKSVLIGTLFYIIIYFLGGLIFGFSRSIYSHSIVSILKNMWQIIVPIICLEYIRSSIINENKNNYIFIVLTTLVFVLLEINYYRFFTTIQNKEDFFKYFSSTILPLIFGNILYTYLTKKGSYKLVLIYRVIVEFVFLIVPIFPSYDWFLTGVFGILTPGIMYLFLRVESGRRYKKYGKKRQKDNPLSYIPFIILLLLFVCFISGVFAYEPIAILSNSMNPLFYKGDVVVYEKVTEKELKNLKKNTIIIYNMEGQAIVHRVIRKYRKGGELYFITKGDANFQRDLKPVQSKDVIGTYQFHVKYLGYPSVLLNRYLKKEKAKVEIK